MFFTKMDGYQKKEKRKKKCDTNKNVTNGLDYKGVYNIWRNLDVIFLQPAGAYCLNMAISEIFSLRSGYFGTFFLKTARKFFFNCIFCYNSHQDFLDWFWNSVVKGSEIHKWNIFSFPFFHYLQALWESWVFKVKFPEGHYFVIATECRTWSSFFYLENFFCQKANLKIKNLKKK